MDIWLIVVIVAVVAIIAVGILIYNGLVQKRLRIDEAYAQIEVQLKRRWDLIPNLVDAVKGYMGFEQKVLTDVTEARANAVAAGAQGPAAQAQAENALSSTLRSLFATVEAYPDLKSNQNVLELQEQLTTTENQISFARQHYNATVLDYNTNIATIPANLIAGPFGFHKREFFDAEPEASQVPEVDLGFGGDDDKPAAGSPPPQQRPPAPPPPPQQPPTYPPQQPPGYPPQQGYQQPPQGYQQPPQGYPQNPPNYPPQPPVAPPPGYQPPPGAPRQ
jgi:LemA protein